MNEQQNAQDQLDDELRKEGPMEAIKDDLRAGKEKVKGALSRDEPDTSKFRDDPDPSKWSRQEAGGGAADVPTRGDNPAWPDNPDQPTPMDPTSEGGSAAEDTAAASLGDVPSREVGEGEEPTPWGPSTGEEHLSS